MKNIILQIIEKNIKINGKMNFFELVKTIETGISTISVEILQTILEKIDNDIKHSIARKKTWEIVRINKRTIKTVLGKIEFNHTYYRNRNTKEYSYLLDQALEIGKYKRIDELLEGKIAELANYVSYENAGKLAHDNLTVSKQKVKKIVEKFSNIEEEYAQKEKKEKRKVKVLFVDADEDHASLQRDAKRNVLNKLIYIHEGKVQECKGRKFLKNRHVFASNKKETDDLWIEVSNYIDATYDKDVLEKIIIQGDGARWIKKGVEWIEKSSYALDCFHLNKAILIVSGGKGNKEVYQELKELVYKKDKKLFLKKAEEIIEKETSESSKNRKIQHMKYIKNQWKGIVENLENREKLQLGCSAEGHVSHILASRMSSRPYGWSREGLEGITQIRVIFANGGTRDNLVKIIKKVNKKVELEKKHIQKNIKRIFKIKNETLGNIPALLAGEVNGVYSMMKDLR